MLAFHVEEVANTAESYDDVWLLDSGASVHMTFRKDFFLNLELFSDGGERLVKLGNQQNVKVCGMGTVMIKKFINGQWEENILNDVIYVPELCRNLFSEGAIMRLGYVIIKRNTTALIYKDNKVVLSATQKPNNLYEMNYKTVISVACNAVQIPENSLRMWHERLGHLNIKEVKNMAKSGLIKSADYPDDNIYTNIPSVTGSRFT
ncbi:Uncharacterized protein OBRU01_11181 [Operophtera brumata]|uniref:Uncharacterized protein n=1 Tax=Operophtera brumata TaxID=104452 RepID=A0A0L7L9S4_OPEBR|nr:Uncharacterized protein OBRU01_11181 [Operophtera brumata]